MSHWLTGAVSYTIFRLYPITTSNRFLSDACSRKRSNPVSGSVPFFYNPTSSSTRNWKVSSWNWMSFKMTNSDHFRLYKSNRNSMNPISGYERKTVYAIGIRWKITDRGRSPGPIGIHVRPTGSDIPWLTWYTEGTWRHWGLGWKQAHIPSTPDLIQDENENTGIPPYTYRRHMIWSFELS